MALGRAGGMGPRARVVGRAEYWSLPRLRYQGYGKGREDCCVEAERTTTRTRAVKSMVAGRVSTAWPCVRYHDRVHVRICYPVAPPASPPELSIVLLFIPYSPPPLPVRVEENLHMHR